MPATQAPPDCRDAERHLDAEFPPPRAGRVVGSGHIDAIVRGRSAQVLFLDLDLLGALARVGESWSFEVEPGGSEQREQAARLAVNVAMYVLCSDYKDDQVHAEWLMRRRRSQTR